MNKPTGKLTGSTLTGIDTLMVNKYRIEYNEYLNVYKVTRHVTDDYYEDIVLFCTKDGNYRCHFETEKECETWISKQIELDTETIRQNTWRVVK